MLPKILKSSIEISGNMCISSHVITTGTSVTHQYKQKELSFCLTKHIWPYPYQTTLFAVTSPWIHCDFAAKESLHGKTSPDFTLCEVTATSLQRYCTSPDFTFAVKSLRLQGKEIRLLWGLHFSCLQQGRSKTKSVHRKKAHLFTDHGFLGSIF